MTPRRSAAPWNGPTYHGRAQLKAAPFNDWEVGGYIFLAGLSGSAAVLGAITGAGRARRHGAMLSLLAPTLGAALLVHDLHTPSRFYNMLRVAKPTSPMSIGTWLLMGFSGAAFTGAAAEFLPVPRLLARMARVAASVTGAGLCTYTAALLAATSTPLWAAAPRPMAMRFGGSSVATGAAALALLQGRGRKRRGLDATLLAALAAELAAGGALHAAYRTTGVDAALEGGWGGVDRIGATALGTAAPLVLAMASLSVGRRGGLLGGAAAGLALLGGFLLRVSTLAAGGISARRPEIGFRFTSKGT